MAKAKYIFIHKNGKISRRTMSPQKATKIGEGTKSIKLYGLASKMVMPRRRRRR